jgi:hypothetical protein
VRYFIMRSKESATCRRGRPESRGRRDRDREARWRQRVGRSAHFAGASVPKLLSPVEAIRASDGNTPLRWPTPTPLAAAGADPLV